MKSVSVVVPVYNVENYLRICVQSILNQNFSDFEVILVDDGSGDTSGDICDEFAAKDDRITVVHQKNGGLSAARNTGIDHSTGKYLMFVDADDYIEKDTLFQSFTQAEQCKADIVIFGYYADVVDRKGNISQYANCGIDVVLTDAHSIAEHVVPMRRNFIFDSCCNKLYLAKNLKSNGIRMPVGENFEDTVFNTALLPYFKTMVITSKCYYHYMQRSDKRITNTYNANKLNLLRKRHLTLLSYLNNNLDHNSIYIKQENYIYCKYVFSSIIDLFSCSADKNISQRREIIKNLLNDTELSKSLQNVKGFSVLDSVVIWVLKTGNIMFTFFFAYFLYLLKFKYRRLFFKIKRIGNRR